MRRSIIAAVMCSLLVFATSAPAAKRASSSQAKAIASAIEKSPVGDFDKLDKEQYEVTGAKISTKSKSWATAKAVAAKGFEDKFQPSYAILVQPAGTRTWVVVDVGSALVGCGIAPDSVVKDLVGACPSAEQVG